MNTATTPLTEQVRRAARESGRGQNALARAAGIDRSNLSRFMSGERGLSMAGLDRLAVALGLTVVEGQGPRKAG